MTAKGEAAGCLACLLFICCLFAGVAYLKRLGNEAGARVNAANSAASIDGSDWNSSSLYARLDFLLSRIGALEARLAALEAAK